MKATAELAALDRRLADLDKLSISSEELDSADCFERSRLARLTMKSPFASLESSMQVRCRIR